MKTKQKFKINLVSGNTNVETIITELAERVVRKSVYDFNSGNYRAKKCFLGDKFLIWVIKCKTLTLRYLKLKEKSLPLAKNLKGRVMIK